MPRPLRSTLAEQLHRRAARLLLSGRTPGEAVNAILRRAREWWEVIPQLHAPLWAACWRVLFLASRHGWRERAGR